MRRGGGHDHNEDLSSSSTPQAESATAVVDVPGAPPAPRGGVEVSFSLRFRVGLLCVLALAYTLYTFPFSNFHTVLLLKIFYTAWDTATASFVQMGDALVADVAPIRPTRPQPRCAPPLPLPFCTDAGDGDACNASSSSSSSRPALPLEPYRKPGRGISLCREQTYGWPYDRVNETRATTYPLLSCDVFKVLADHLSLDDKSYGCERDADKIACGDIVFVHAVPVSFDAWMAKKHPLVRYPYIMVGCGFDYNTPHASAVLALQRQSEERPKLWAWYGQNVEAVGIGEKEEASERAEGRGSQFDGGR